VTTWLRRVVGWRAGRRGGRAGGEADGRPQRAGGRGDVPRAHRPPAPAALRGRVPARAGRCRALPRPGPHRRARLRQPQVRPRCAQFRRCIGGALLHYHGPEPNLPELGMAARFRSQGRIAGRGVANPQVRAAARLPVRQGSGCARLLAVCSARPGRAALPQASRTAGRRRMHGRPALLRQRRSRSRCLASSHRI